jgi:hypothetical protein
MVTFKNLGKYGRLGNQLFQIAATIGISRKNNMEFYFPDWYCTYTNNNFNNFIKNKLPILKSNTPLINIEEKSFEYNEIILRENLNYNINGYFQSEKYFIDYIDDIKYFLSLEDKYTDYILKKYNDILKNSCSIHVRRGDYLILTNKHPVLNIDYYINSLKKIYGKNYNDANVLIFSDDINWCKSNFNFKNQYFIDENIDIIDLFLMSFCQNNIIANSSFSWWGAWLNNNPEKKVVAPSKWFGESLKLNTSDIIPENWTKL